MEFTFAWLCCLLFIVFKSKALPYDYTATTECLPTPYKPLYNGGIIVNPAFDNGLRGWHKFGYGKIENRQINGNKFLVAFSRRKPADSVAQRLYLHANHLYSVSAWVQVKHGSAPVTAMFKTTSGFINSGIVIAKSGCWSMLKGGLSVDVSGYADLYFETKNTSAEIWVDSVSLQPFTEEEWRSHHQESIEKARKSKMRIKVVDKQGKAMPNSEIHINQQTVSFPIGCAMNKNILSNTAYQNWFTSRFRVTTFEDEMKWYSTEGAGQGKVDYSIADAMMSFSKLHNIAVRGHNVLWDDPRYQPFWVSSLSEQDLNKAAVNRVSSLVSRYRGQVIAWDVVNENLHFSFLESKIGSTASSVFYHLAHVADPEATLFLNEFNTIENKGDESSAPTKYLQKLNEIKAGSPGNNNLKYGIGLESHFRVPNIAYMRSSIDMLASTNYPVWLTEVDVESGPNQATFLEQILREGHGHPKVSGIVLWSAWKPSGCYKMCLTDNNFRNLPTGDVVDKFLREWGGLKGQNHSFTTTTDENGYFEANLFHGDYEVIFHGQAINISVNPEEETSTILLQESL